MQSLIILSTIASAALAAPLPGGADVVGNTLQGVGAAAGGVAAAVGATVNAGVNAVDVKATYNTIGNNVLDENKVKVLKRDGAAVDGATKQATGALGGVAGVAAGVVGNVAANVGDVDVECNEILNNVGNNNDVQILKRDGAVVDGATKQVGGAVGGVLGATVGAVVNGAVKAVTVIVDGNTILNGVLDNNTVKILSPRDGGAVVNGATDSASGAVGGVAGAAVNGVVNAAVKAVTVIVDGNTILNGVLDKNTVKILSPRDGAAVDGVTKQTGGAVGGVVGATVGAVANAAVDAVNVDATYNTIGNNVGNGNFVDVLKRDGAAVDGVTKQVTGAAGGVAGAAVGATVNAAVKAVKVVLADNTIANGVLDGNFVKILRRDGAAVAGATQQGTGAVGGVAGAAVGAVANVAANLVKIVVDNNTILNGVLDGNTIKVLS